MAVATGATALAGMAGGVSKFFEGQQLQRDAQKAINEFRWQDLQNPYENQQVSTLGADLKQEQANLAASQGVSALQQGGTRALVGGLGRVEAQRNLVNREVASDLDQQQKAINMAKAQQDVMNQQMIEKRQGDELQGYGQMMNVGLGMKYGGISDIANAAGAAGTALSGLYPNGLPATERVPQETLSQMTPQGTTYANSLSIKPLPQLNPYSPTPNWLDALSKVNLNQL